MEILKIGDILLAKKAKHIDLGNKEERDCVLLSVNKMQELMYQNNGIGLAANQVGILKRFFILDVDQKTKTDKDGNILERVPGNLHVFINPELSFGGDLVIGEEGCLSVPGVYECVKRYSFVNVKYYDINFEKKEKKFEGLLSIVIQHEYDHLEGKLFIDRLSSVKKTIIKNKLKKGKLL
jgi:peptide deformylase